MRPRPIDLLLLPYAGAGAGVFRHWGARLPDWVRPVPVTLPGRGIRYGEPPLHDWQALIERLAGELRPVDDRPFALFGHSLGALVGLELAHALRSRCGREPVWFCAAGAIAPSLRRTQAPNWLDCPEATFLDELRTLDGTPPELLENRELLDLVLPALRADFHLAGTYAHRRRVPLSMPLMILGGAQDARVSAAPDNLSAWSIETSGAARVEMIEGGHFFLNNQPDAVIRLTIEGLSEALGAMEAAHA